MYFCPGYRPQRRTVLPLLADKRYEERGVAPLDYIQSSRSVFFFSSYMAGHEWITLCGDIRLYVHFVFHTPGTSIPPCAVSYNSQCSGTHHHVCPIIKVVMNKKRNCILVIILAISVSVLISGCSNRIQKPENNELTSLGFRLISEGKEFPDITFTDINGESKKLSDYRGNVLLLNFWATWCPPCRAEMPSMEKLADKLNSGDFVMLPVNVKETGDMVKTFTAEFGIDFPVYLDINAEAAMTVGVTALPTSILIDREGKAVAAATGALEWDSEEMINMMRNWTR